MIKVVVAENSLPTRAALLRLIEQDPQVQVVGTATTGREALALAKRHRPNLVVLGLDLCVSEDFDTGQEIMIEAPTPIVLLKQAGQPMPTGRSMLDLCGGAVAVLELPSSDTSVKRRIEEAFLAKLKAMAKVKVVRQWRRNQPQPPARQDIFEEAPIRLIAIAASTGGPAALRHILGGLPVDFPVPILIVQHVAQGFAQNIATWLDSVCPLHVKLATDQERICPGTAYLAPDDQHLGLASRSRLMLTSEAPVDGFRPSASYLFRSVARHYGASALSLILTGMGRDGVEGLREIKQAGGRVIAQDEATSIVFGMPGEAVREGVVDTVLPLGEITAGLIELTRRNMTGVSGG
ncbi:chemotaxis protein CheB [Pedomonas mirosovicensis]|uniref:chemotaxis protein CheB n=1 Tax=Pedomonas mirosovicensis TaxID=2908641 RepID=UPI002169E4DD|nr:chemotaxis protein CheB [Pedomonas mirosovicensis]MCH8686725.1 chemotaxis protein CheB [Pedomonas mirosovicensis]